MLVLVIESAPPKILGYCSSWALQISTGVYVANLPAGTRDEIWEQLVKWADAQTKVLMLWSTSVTEQGLQFRALGAPRRTISEREGLLISTWIPRDGLSDASPEQRP